MCHPPPFFRTDAKKRRLILTAVVTFFFPQLFAWVKGDTQTIILGIIMLTMGLTLTPGDFKLLAQRPLDILIGEKLGEKECDDGGQDDEDAGLAAQEITELLEHVR